MRIGRFRISEHYIRTAAQDPERPEAAELRSLWSFAIPIDASYHFESESYEYLAASQYFADVPDGEVAPFYRVVLEVGVAPNFISDGSVRP